MSLWRWKNAMSSPDMPGFCLSPLLGLSAHVYPDQKNADA
jgi:hypothetical protein